jgi:hypothetical protein
LNGFFLEVLKYQDGNLLALMKVSGKVFAQEGASAVQQTVKTVH